MIGVGDHMKKTFTVLATVFLLFTVGWGQSGRRVVKPAATPTPQAVEDPTDYSESTPQKRRDIPPPTFRSVPDNSKTNTVTQPTGTANTTVSDSDDVVKVETNLVTIPVSVYDRHGLYVPGLRQKDFKIFEDGKEQEIAYFGTSDKPFTVILLLDTSPSTEYKMDEIHAAAAAFVDQLKPQDKVMVIEFAMNVHVLTEPTSDRPAIYKAIKRADFGDSTSLYDAVDFSLTRRLSKIDGRKAVVLFTDGVDTSSRRATYDSTLSLAEESEALVFPIYYNTFFDTQDGVGLGGINGGIIPGSQSQVRGTSSGEYALGRKYLDDLAAYTGGRVFRPEATPGGLTAAFEGIAEELRRQYNIGYIPADEGKPGQRKQIKVRVNRPELVLRARDSYIVGANRSGPAPATPVAKPN